VLASFSKPAPDVIQVAHSPDADDAFMFYALAEHKVDTEGLSFKHVLCDIETLNHEAFKGTYELTALSYHGYAYVADKYAILPVGSSIGDKYGPILVSRQQEMVYSQLSSGAMKVAIPGRYTSAALALKLWCPTIETIEMPFDDIIPAILRGEVEAGVIIHEGQLTYFEQGLHKWVDLGEWWFDTTNLVLPLGCNGIRKDLGSELIQKIGRVLYRSIAWGLENRAEALAGCQKYAGDLAPEKTDTFVGMYVNQHTLEADIEVRKAVKLMLWMGAGFGLIPNKVEPEFVAFEKPAALTV
jgi:1,4-dihydroxy-6-naphthoate synthase